MFSKTRFGENSREKIRMLRTVLLDTPNPPDFNLDYIFPTFNQQLLVILNRMEGCESEWDGVGWDPMGGDPWEPKGIPWEGTNGRGNP